jgi:hypothetical protein
MVPYYSHIYLLIIPQAGDNKTIILEIGWLLGYNKAVQISGFYPVSEENIMAKKVNKNIPKAPSKEEKAKRDSLGPNTGAGYLWSMSYAPSIDEGVHWFQLMPIAFYTAVIIMITQMANYTRPMEQFFWYSGGDDLVDFFSYYKMMAILICTGLVLLILLYRVFTQSLAIKRTPYYIPMAVYTLFVVLSHVFSDYKEFALYGWNDRFEGTLVLIGYMVILFYTLNSINTEKAVKWIVYPTGITTGILGILGVTQALDKDFFRTALGQKLITPNSVTESGETINELIDKAKEAGELLLNFTFVNKEIYQTVYNINYVSFYLTLLIPLFGFIFIHSVMMKKEEPLWKKIAWGGLFALLLFNLIGSASSGGYLGMGVTVVLALVMLNKYLIKWWKPLLILVVIAILIAGATTDRWMPEMKGAMHGVLGTEAPAVEDPEAVPEETHTLDSILTIGNDIIIGVDGNEMTLTTDPQDPLALIIKDAEGKTLDLVPTDVSPIYTFEDERFDFCLIQPAQSEAGDNFFIFSMDNQKQNWVFRITDEGVFYNNELGNPIVLDEVVPSIGWENNLAFGSGRGYIWSRTLPMMKETLLIGHGADTYCIYFPHQDYVGKYQAKWNINMIVDKPHNMYMGMWVGTGMISVLAFMAMLLIYAIQSIKLYWRIDLKIFTDYAGYGIFLGIVAFCVTGLVDDSSVSVMPMFYGLLGVGMSINIMLKRIGTKRRAQAS